MVGAVWDVAWDGWNGAGDGLMSALMKAWWLLMTFRYNPNDEVLFAMACWVLFVGSIAGSIVMAYDIRDMIND